MDTTLNTSPEPDQNPGQKGGGGGLDGSGGRAPNGFASENFNAKNEILESRLTGRVGLTRDELRAFRQKNLDAKRDWYLKKKRVVWTESGVEKLRAHIAVPEIKTAPAQNAALPEPVTLLVWKSNLTNKRIVLAYKPGTDPQRAENILRVQVRSSENFVRFVNGKPMELKARHLQADYYELAGACPRRKGRW